MIPTCTTDCTAALAVTKSSKCAPIIVGSEIVRVFVAKATAAPLADWKLATEWTARISDTDVTNDDVIRAIPVIGDKPAPAPINRDISNGRRQVLGKDHTVNMTIDDLSDENYAFMQTLECGGQYKFWYETAGGYIYGGNNGVLVNLNFDDILNRGRDEIETLAGTATWRAKFTPERVKSPIFDNGEVVTTPVVPAA